MKELRVLLYSEAPVLAAGLGAVMEGTQFRLLPVCCTISQVAARVHLDLPDVVLLETTRALTFDALSCLREVAQAFKVVLWTSDSSSEFIFQAMGLGVRGVLEKAVSLELHLDCLARVSEGQLQFPKHMTDAILCGRRTILSRREGELVTLLAGGLKNKEIAARMKISEGTIKVYMSRLFAKVGVRDRFELALFGLKHLGADRPSPTPHRQAGAHIRSLIRPASVVPIALLPVPSPMPILSSNEIFRGIFE